MVNWLIWDIPEVFHWQKKKETPIHPLIEIVRAVIEQHRLKSLAHFSVEIHANPFDEDDFQARDSLTKHSKVQIVIGNWSNTETKTCRPVFRRRKLAKNVQIRENNNWMSLRSYLNIHFPADPSLITEDTMREWWFQNGKTFDWPNLPAELRENVLRFCVSHHVVAKTKHRRPFFRPSGPYEIFGPLTEWSSLLRVDHVTREMVLRLILNYNYTYPAPCGLQIFIESLGNLRNTIHRLDNHLQLILPQNARPNVCIPLTPHEHLLAQQYRYFPLQHPHLSHYATFKHGIRHLYLQLNFLDTLHFFKVEKGNLADYRGPNFSSSNSSCDVLFALTYLKSLHVELPDARDWTDRVYQNGPTLFHETAPCPRVLHRWIYERAAEVVAEVGVGEVKMSGVLDGEEEHRWKRCWERCVKERKERMEGLDLEELYEECEGGVEIEVAGEGGQTGAEKEGGGAVSTYKKRWMQERSKSRGDVFRWPGPADEVDEVDQVFPPECQCAVQCRTLY